jgi:predicted DNA-binding transcriptional regulator AlpA
MIDTERQPAAQVAMAHKAAALKQKNEERKRNQQKPPQRNRSERGPRAGRTTRQDNSRTEASDGEGEDDSGEPDSLVPDAQVAKELGTGVMGLWRRTNDPDDDFPAPIKIRSRNFRSRKALEAYKARKLREAMRTHHARLNVRRRVPIPDPELELSNARRSRGA